MSNKSSIFGWQHLVTGISDDGGLPRLGHPVCHKVSKTTCERCADDEVDDLHHEAKLECGMPPKKKSTMTEEATAAEGKDHTQESRKSEFIFVIMVI